MEQFNDVEM